MAVAFHSAVMQSPGEHAVHPFFTSTRDHTPAKTPEPDLSTDRAQMKPSKTNLSIGEQTSDGAVPVGEKKRRGRPPGKQIKKGQPINSGQLQLTSGGVTDSSGRLVLLKHPPLDTFSNHIDPASAEKSEDQNERNKKRRRVSAEYSAAHELTTSDLSAQTSTMNHSESAKPANTVDIISCERIFENSCGHNNLNNGALISAENHHISDSAHYQEISASKEESSLQNLKASKYEGGTEARVVSKPETPPKKIIKLRTDGKLISPKNSSNVTGKRGKQKNEQQSDSGLSARVVKIVYGTESLTREDIGQRINQVLLGKIRVKLSSSDQMQKFATMTRPTKSTHPFFARSTLQKLPQTSAADTKVANDIGQNVNSNISPRKTNGLAKASWAGFGSTFSKPVKHLSAIDAVWPPSGMVHVRGNTEQGEFVSREVRRSQEEKKLKSAVVEVCSGDEVLAPYERIVRSAREPVDTTLSVSFRKPKRRLMTGPELQYKVKERLQSRLPPPRTSNIQSIVETSSQLNAAHTAVLDIFNKIGTSLTAFDKFECENNDWVHKYAPTCASKVLQNNSEPFLLRDWLQNLVVNSTDDGKSILTSHTATENARKIRTKLKYKRKRLGELSDFVVSDEEDGYVDELTDPEDIVTTDRGPRMNRLTKSNLNKTKAVVVTGPHGCGKTATIYAIARELGFEVFEINAGTRRSGKEIMDRVGDMTRNHLVRQKVSETVTSLGVAPETPEVQTDAVSGRQSTMGSFFKTPTVQKLPTKSKKTRKSEEASKKKNDKRQSLILLEEVDILFEEDKLFWSTVLTLLVDSRRPIIMTCVDEKSLPLDEMLNCRSLRLYKPSLDIASEYLLTLAANEGHLLSLKALEKLYLSHNSDLRASIMHLDFCCQMAIGDTKNGLEWMLIRSNKEECHNEHGEPLRVVSDGTFTDFLGALPEQDNVFAFNQLGSDNTYLSEAAMHWNYDVEDWIDLLDPVHLNRAMESRNSLEDLTVLDLAFDALSAADILPGSKLFDNKSDPLDPTSGALTEGMRNNYTIDFHVLNDIRKHELTSQCLEIVLSTKLLAGHLAFGAILDEGDSLDPKYPTSKLINSPHSRSLLASSKASSVVIALDPLSHPASNTIIGNKGPMITTMAQPLPVLAAEVIPYVRGIANFDIQLEQERLRLSNLLSQGGRQGKKQRTTRASRAALEGGRKESTRRERWFPKNLNLRNIVATGPTHWNDLVRNGVWKREDEAGLENLENFEDTSSAAYDTETENLSSSQISPNDHDEMAITAN